MIGTSARVPEEGGIGNGFCSLFGFFEFTVSVGQNGLIWVDGEADDVKLALEGLQKIEAEAHTSGLTDRMKAWLEELRASGGKVQNTLHELGVLIAQGSAAQAKAWRALPGVASVAADSNVDIGPPDAEVS